MGKKPKRHGFLHGLRKLCVWHEVKTEEKSRLRVPEPEKEKKNQTSWFPKGSGKEVTGKSEIDDGKPKGNLRPDLEGGRGQTNSETKNRQRFPNIKVYWVGVRQTPGGLSFHPGVLFVP